jgi:hypothetical protein
MSEFCPYWKDFGYDDGGEVCKLSMKKTLCQSKLEDCECIPLKNNFVVVEEQGVQNEKDYRI